MISRDYPPEFVMKALELAAAIGIRPAAGQLEIEPSTLQRWTVHPEAAATYAELRRTNAPKWRERAAVPMEDLVDAYSEAEVKVLSAALEAMENGDLGARDIPNLLRSIAVSKGIASDKVDRLRGQPTSITEHRHSAEQIEAGLRALLEEAQTIDHQGPVEELPSGDQHGPSDHAGGDRDLQAPQEEAPPDGGPQGPQAPRG